MKFFLDNWNNTERTNYYENNTMTSTRTYSRRVKIGKFLYFYIMANTITSKLLVPRLLLLLIIVVYYYSYELMMNG